MTKCRIIFKNYWRTGAILAKSSEHPQFPAENTQIDTSQEVWSSRYGSASGNGLFVITATTKYINFDEGAAELTATLTAGSYTGATLAAHIQTVMRAAGALAYLVTYSETTGLFTIATASTNFTLRWNNGTNKANGAAVVLGYSDAANDTGAHSFSSDNRRLHYPAEYIDLDAGSAVACDFLALMNHNISAAAVIKLYGADDAAFTTNLVTLTITHNANNIYAFVSSTTKRYWRVEIADPTNTGSYIQIGTIVLGKYWEPTDTFLAGYEDGYGDESTMEASDSLVEFGQDKPIYRVNPSLPFRLNATDKAEVSTFFSWVKTTFGFVMCWDSSYPNSNSYWLRNVELVVPVNVAWEYWEWSMNAKEIL